MNRTTCLLMCLSLGSVGVYADDKKPPELTDPLEILRKVDAAAKAVQSVKYEVIVEALGEDAAQRGKTKATFIAAGFANGAVLKYRADATVTMPGTTEARMLSVGTDNDMFFLIDHRGKIAYEDMDPAVIGRAARVFQQAQVIEFLHDTPFSDEINARSRKLLGSKMIGDEDCYEIQVVYAAERAPEATWYFSKKDFLPRRRIDKYTMQEGGTRLRQKTIQGLVVNPKIDHNTFRLKLPDGYTKTDDFAPDFLKR